MTCTYISKIHTPQLFPFMDFYAWTWNGKTVPHAVVFVPNTISTNYRKQCCRVHLKCHGRICLNTYKLSSSGQPRPRTVWAKVFFSRKGEWGKWMMRHSYLPQISWSFAGRNCADNYIASRAFSRNAEKWVEVYADCGGLVLGACILGKATKGKLVYKTGHQTFSTFGITFHLVVSKFLHLISIIQHKRRPNTQELQPWASVLPGNAGGQPSLAEPTQRGPFDIASAGIDVAFVDIRKNQMSTVSLSSYKELSLCQL